MWLHEPWRLLRQPEKFGKRISHSFLNEEENVMAVKYVFVTGGVVSGLGKGITAASLGRLLKARGYKVTIQKFDPYINVDPGTMSPYQHGEVFVTDDGAETDLDSDTTKDLLTNPKINFLAARKVGYLIPAGIIVLGAISMSTIGLNNGIDFTGGRNYVIRFAQDVKTDEVRNLLDAQLDGSVSVIQIGTPDQVRVSTNYKIEDNDPAIDQEIENKLFEGVKSLLPEGTTLASVHGSVYPELTEGGTEYGRRYQERCVPRCCIRYVLYGGLHLASFPRHLIFLSVHSLL